MPPSLSVSVGVPPVHRHRLAHRSVIDDWSPASGRRSPETGRRRRHRRRRGFDLQPGLRQTGAGQVGGVASAVRDGAALRLLPVTASAASVLTGRHRVVEHQRRRRIRRVVGRGAAVVERQRRRAARATVTASLIASVIVNACRRPVRRSPEWPWPPSPSAPWFRSAARPG